MYRVFKYFTIIIILTIGILSCSKKEKEINIAVNEWIGYAPLFYANEKGWLKKDNIRLIRTVSLGESLSLYKGGLVDGLTATQYEYMQIRNEVVPIVLLDKSYGGDMILSNKTLYELQHTNQKIDVYLEIDSVNYLLLQYFIKKYHILFNKLNIINGDQQQLITNNFNLDKPIIIVTYAPYDVDYEKKGFKKIDSTREDKNLLVIDALFINKKLYNKNRFIGLKKDIDKAIYEIQKNPREAYDIIKKYFPNYDYLDFVNALHNILWINKPSEEILKEIKDLNLPTKELLK